MSFFKEVSEIFGLEWAKVSLGYSYVNYNGNAVYIEGFKKVLSVEGDCLKFLVGKKEILTVSGSDLAIFLLEKNTIMIKGLIKSIEVGNDN